MENIAQGLSLHRGSRLVTRDELARIDTPEATATWRPAPHIAVVEAVERAAARAPALRQPAVA